MLITKCSCTGLCFMHISDCCCSTELRSQPGQSCSSWHDAETQKIQLWGIWGICLEFDQFRPNYLGFSPQEMTGCKLIVHWHAILDFPSVFLQDTVPKSTWKYWRSPRAAATSTKSKIFFPYLQKNVFNPSHGKQIKHWEIPTKLPFSELDIPAFSQQLLNNCRALQQQGETSNCSWKSVRNFKKKRNFRQAFPVFAWLSVPGEAQLSIFSRKSHSTLSSSCCRILLLLLPRESVEAAAEGWEFWESLPRAVNAQHRVWKKGSSWVMLDTECRLSRGNLGFLAIPSGCFGS